MSCMYMNHKYLFDTHALIFWINKENVSEGFINFFDEQRDSGALLISSISFWEIALLAKKGKIEFGVDVNAWRQSIFENTNINLINPSAFEMIKSVQLPDHHKDPFDRLLTAQAIEHDALFVTKDEKIKEYDVRTFWM